MTECMFVDGDSSVCTGSMIRGGRESSTNDISNEAANEGVNVSTNDSVTKFE
jgi:hypothetical protein